jgi:AcrR family transcriptional regulator
MVAVGTSDAESPEVTAALEAASTLFAIDGLYGTSMDDIAAAARLTKPALYRRFGSKDALFERTVERECTRLTDHLLSAYALALELPVEERLLRSFDAFFQYSLDRPHGFRLLFCTSHHRSSTVAERIDDMRRQITDRVAAMVRHELAVNGNHAPVAADVLATFLVGMGEHAARRLLDEPSWDRAGVVRLLARFATAGGLGVERSTLHSLEGDHG